MPIVLKLRRRTLEDAPSLDEDMTVCVDEDVADGRVAQQWLEQYGGKIMRQFRLLGASLDYRRERFTMDPGYYRAVIRWFVHLYERGWIYRDNRMANWCPRDRTALSDLEVEHDVLERRLGNVEAFANRSVEVQDRIKCGKHAAPQGRPGRCRRPRG